jgi:hypothetical protein
VLLSTLKEKLSFLDGLMDKVTKKVYLVLYEELHYVWVIQDGGIEPPEKLAKNIINLAYTKVDPKVVRILYAESPNSLSESISDGK